MHALMRIHACASTRKPARDFARTPGWAVSIDTLVAGAVQIPREGLRVLAHA